jgi:hypothetical protein
MRSSWRFTRGAFLRRLWLFIPFVRRIFPVGVMRKRFLAPLCVFIFLGAWLLLAPLLVLTFSVSFLLAIALPVRDAHLRFEGSNEHIHRPAFHPRRLFDRAMRTELLGELVEQGLAQVRVRHLAPTEEDGDFHLVPGIEEFRRLPPLGFEVVVVDLGPDADLFQLDDMLMATGLTLLAALLVAVFAVVHEPADGRHGIRRHLDQVESTLARHLERIECRDDADLLAVLIDEPDLANPDTLVDAGLDGSGNNPPPLPITGSRYNTGTRRGLTPARSP